MKSFWQMVSYKKCPCASLFLRSTYQHETSFKYIKDRNLPWVPIRFRSSLEKFPPCDTLKDSGRISKMMSSCNSPLVSSAEGQRCVGLRPMYGVHLRTKIIENKRQFEVQKLGYPCRNRVIWIWNHNELSRNSIIRTWSNFEQVETIKGKLDIADVEIQITTPTKMQIAWFELQFTFSSLISHLIVNNTIIIFHKIPNETFNLNLKSRHIFEFEKPKFQFERKRK